VSPWHPIAPPVPAGNDLRLGPPRKLFRNSIRHSPFDARDSYAAMPDGRSFLIDAGRADATSAITVMVAWANGLAALRSDRQAEVISRH